MFETYLRSAGHCNQHTLVNRLKPATIKVIRPATTNSEDEESKKGMMQKLGVIFSFFFFSFFAASFPETISCL